MKLMLLSLLTEAQRDANLPMAEKRKIVEVVLKTCRNLESALRVTINAKLRRSRVIS